MKNTGSAVEPICISTLLTSDLVVLLVDMPAISNRVVLSSGLNVILSAAPLNVDMLPVPITPRDILIRPTPPISNRPSATSLTVVVTEAPEKL